jgi:hypothetical protein
VSAPEIFRLHVDLDGEGDFVQHIASLVNPAPLMPGDRDDPAGPVRPPLLRWLATFTWPGRVVIIIGEIAVAYLALAFCLLLGAGIQW